MRSHRDVIVAGGGPSGAAAAAALARAGFDVLVCERARSRGERLCGEFLSADASATLVRLGAMEDVDALAPASIDTLRLTSPRGRSITRSLDPGGRGVSRRALDAALLAHAVSNGAEVWPGCRVIACRRRDRFHVSALIDGKTVMLEARALIDATGRARQLGGRSRMRDRARDRRGALVGIRCRHVLERPSCAPEVGHTLALAMFEGGYAGRAPIERGGVNVCLLARAADLRGAGGRPARFISTLAERWPGVRELLDGLRPDGEIVTAASIVLGPAEGGPAVAAGDAAETIAPLAGDGIAMALRSGEFAAAAVSGHLAGRYAWERAQARALALSRREFGGRLRLAGALQRLAVRSGSANALIGLLVRAPGTLDRLVSGTRGAPDPDAQR